jgi:hypothetical protein
MSATVTDAEPEVAAAVRLLHRRHGWSWTAGLSLAVFGLGAGSWHNADAAGTPPPPWFLDMTIALGALAVVSLAAIAACSALLRRKPAAVLTQAAPIAARHRHARHHLPWGLVIWPLFGIGVLVLLVMAVVSAPALVDGTAYLAGAEKTVTFDPLSYQTTCTSSRYSGSSNPCSTMTEGILETGGAGTSATWQTVVPLGKPIRAHEPLWRWGLGLSLITSGKIAVIAIVISLLIEASAVLIVVRMIMLAVGWRRHRHAS